MTAIEARLRAEQVRYNREEQSTIARIESVIEQAVQDGKFEAKTLGGDSNEKIKNYFIERGFDWLHTNNNIKISW